MNIAIVVPGRFIAFNQAEALLNRGHQVTLFTNYPASIVRRLGVDGCAVETFVIHGIALRFFLWLYRYVHIKFQEKLLHSLFGVWAEKKLSKKKWDLILCWSGVAEEVFLSRRIAVKKKILIRGSAHIRYECNIMKDEQLRVGMPLNTASEWMISREEREYELADAICVLSSYSKKTFIESSSGYKKIFVVPPSYSLKEFGIAQSVLEERCLRIISGRKLRILYVGTVSYQKGFYDLTQILNENHNLFQWRIVGPWLKECDMNLFKGKSDIEIVGKKREGSLVSHYAWADIFILPTLSDGFAMVLVQALSSGLPVLSTVHSAAVDLVRDYHDGWVLPIRRPDLFSEKLHWCHENRAEFSAMVKALSGRTKTVRTWAEVGAEIEKAYANS